MPTTRLSSAVQRGRSSLRVFLAFGVLAGACSTALFAGSAQANSPCSTASGVTTCTYSTTGEQQVTIPVGVSAINVDAIGGAGGAALGGSGGLGAEVTATLPLASPGPTTLYVEVGGDGTNNPTGSRSNVPGGFNGGGTSEASPPIGTFGGGGGGASDVRTEPAADGLSPDPRLIVAGGGGGGGSSYQANVDAGSGDAGANPGDGGSGYVVPGSGVSCGADGGGGTATQGGADGQGLTAGNGSLGQGGSSGGGGGGGGGGYYGGGAGEGCGAGGAGSGYVSPSASTHAFLAATSAAPSVTISYTVSSPPTVTITTPPNNASYIYGQTVDANYTCTAGTNATLKSCTGTVAEGKPINTSTVGSGQSFAVTATDTDGQTDTVTNSYTVVAGAPSVTITTPPNGATYTYGKVVDASYSCTAGAGGTLKSCVGTVANGSPIGTSTVGSGQSFAVTATDTDSQTTTVTHSYTVTAASTSLKAAPQLVLFEPFVGIGNQVVQATLTSGGSPLAGQTISFGDGSTPLCSAPTNSKGVARCAISSFDQALVNRNNEYTATFTATTDYTGSTSTVPAVTFIS